MSHVGSSTPNKVHYVRPTDKLVQAAAVLATDAARFHSTSKKFRVGAAVFDRDLVEWGANNPLKTHPRSRAPYHTIHAELSAIIKASRYRPLDGMRICVVRITKSGLRTYSRPCEFCIELLRDAGIYQMVYVGQDRQLVAEAVG